MPLSFCPFASFDQNNQREEALQIETSSAFQDLGALGLSEF